MQDLAAGLGYDSEPRPSSLAEWAEGTPIILDGKPFSFYRHEYLRLPYEDDHSDMTILKAAQGGWTTYAINRALFGARWKGFIGILYLFPNRSDALDFSKSRITPLIENNPNTIGSWLKDTDAAGIKQIGSAFLYLRGMRSRAGLKSVPCSFVVADELDEAPQDALDKAMERMSHSEIKQVLKLSNPSLPDYGVDAAFQQTDQRYFLLKCHHCGEWTSLVDTFPGCLLEVQGKVIRGCQRCKSELNPSVGEWVAKKPRVTDKRGYQFSQLLSHFVNPAEILHQYRTTKNLQDFWNLKIGIAYVESSHRVTVEEALALCGNEGIVSSSPGPCFMGVDQGKDLHVVIGRRHPVKAGKIIHLGIYKDWEELDRLMKNFNVSRCIVDGLPEQRNARAFAERFRGRVFLNFYQEGQKGRYLWNERDLTVKCNRTESLDASHNEILAGQIIFPKECEIVREFARHLHNMAKKLEEDEETGSKRYVYVRLKDDHFRHAYNYEVMCRQSMKESFFGGCDLS